MGAGGGQSSGSSNSMTDALSLALGQSTSGGTSGTFIDPVQQANQTRLNDIAMGSLGAGQAGVNTAARTSGNALTDAMGATSAQMDPTAQIAAQTASLKSGLGDLFTKEINPAIEGTSLSTGGFGGGRQGVAQGVAATGLADSFKSGVGDIVARANAQSLNAAQLMPALAQANIDAAGAPSGYSLAQMMNTGSILGSPTILSQSDNYSQSTNQAVSESRARANSENESYDFEFGWT